MMTQGHGKFTSFYNLVLLATFLVMLTSQGGQGCVCPSCHYTSATQNCQCCVFRQLGKRGDDPPVAMTHDLPLPADADHWRSLSRPTRDGETARLAEMERAQASDWFSKRRSHFFYGGVSRTDETVTSQPNYVIMSKVGRMFNSYPRINPKHFRLLENADLDRAFDDGDNEKLYSYN